MSRGLELECGNEEGDTEEEMRWGRSREHIEGEARGERAWREGGRKLAAPLV